MHNIGEIQFIFACILKIRSCMNIPAKNLDDSNISLLLFKLMLSGSNSRRCIMNEIVVGGFANQSKLCKINSSVWVILLGLNFPEHIHAWYMK